MEIDRRAFLATGIAAAASTRAPAERGDAAKRAAIEALQLPAAFNGTIAYGRRGVAEHVRYTGFADIEARRPVSGETRFRWGSATKWLATVALLRVFAERRLSLDTPIGQLLPGFRPDTGARVQVRHLLSNTSGIPDLLGRQVAKEPELRQSSASYSEIIARFAGGDLAFAPGEDWDYAALNWVMVAGLLQQVTGRQFPALVRDLVFTPLRMSGAGFDQGDQPPAPHLAAAYGAVAPPSRRMPAVPPFLGASGNVAGTVSDAMRAADGIFAGTLLSPAQRRELTRVRWPAEDYALGGRIRSIDGVSWAWEAGKVGGYRALIAHCPATRETIVIFNNTDLDQSVIGAWAEAIARA